MTVYITQEVRGRDLSDALSFGELDVLIPAKDQIALSAAPTVRRMLRKLSKFTDKDYLVLSGDPVCIGIACAIAATSNNGKFQVLKWDRLDQIYYPIQVNLFGKEKESGSVSS